MNKNKFPSLAGWKKVLLALYVVVGSITIVYAGILAYNLFVGTINALR